jgi:hypothetical protein
MAFQGTPRGYGGSGDRGRGRGGFGGTPRGGRGGSRGKLPSRCPPKVYTLRNIYSSGRLRLTALQVASAVIEVALAIEEDEVEGAAAVEVHQEEVEALQEGEVARNLVSEEELKL